jgi:hypothetical protein
VLSMPPMFILSQDQTLHESLILTLAETSAEITQRFFRLFGFVSITLLLVRFVLRPRVSPSAGSSTIHPLELYVKSFPFSLGDIPTLSLRITSTSTFGFGEQKTARWNTPENGLSCCYNLPDAS